MDEQRKSPSSESPAGDGSHPGQEAERKTAPETGERAPNQPGESRDPKAAKAHGRQKRTAMDTGALLSRITGLLRSAAEEAPGDPIFPAASAQPPEADAQRPQPADELDESGFLESLRGQPRQGTGQLRIMVTGAVREPEDEAGKNEPSAETETGQAETSAVEAAAPLAADEDVDAFLSRLTYPTEVTGRLNAPFTGTLRAADDLSDLRAEMEAESQPSLPEDDEHFLDLLLQQRENGAEAAQENIPLPAVEDDDALLEDRFAMLGADAPAPFAPHVMASEEEPAESALASEQPSTGPQFDDAVMFPDEPAPPTFVESTVPAAASEPGDAPISFITTDAQPKIDDLDLAEPENQVVAEPAPRGKTSQRSETIYEDLRQTLAEEELEKRRRTGGLLRRITGSLRRTTDSLRKGKTGPVGQQPEPQQEPLEAELVPNPLDAAVDPDAEPDFSMFNLDDAAEEPRSEPAWASEAAADLPEDALLAGLDASGQPLAEEPLDEDWMNALRQEGVEEPVPPAAAEEMPVAVEAALPAEPAPEPEARPRTITGRLAKIVTGVLGGQAARKKTTKELDIPDEMVTGRLQRSMVTGPLNPSKTRQLDPETLDALDSEQMPPAPEMTSVEEGTPVENTVEEAFPEPRNQGITGQLRSFITGILRSSEPPGSTGPLQTGELPTPVEQEAPTRQRVTPRRTSERRETFDAQMLRHDVIDTPIPTPGPAPAAPEVSEEELLRNLGVTSEPDDTAASEAFAPAHTEMDDDLPEDRFGAMFGGAVAAEGYPAGGETGALEEVDGNADTFVEATPGELGAEDIWGAGLDQAAADPRTPEETIWFVPDEDDEGQPRGTGSLFADELNEEALVSAYLAGQAVRKEAPAPASNGASAPDLRAIALENYGEDEEFSPASQVDDAAGEEAHTLEDGQPAVKHGLWDRVARLTVLQKILLAEVVLLVVLVPFLVFAALTAPKAENPVIVFPMPRALPEGVPYPTGLTLPGGWRFDLQKSTFVEGDWKPTGSEWLEGTEVRRVVALPWNKQTDAVVRTFQPGDKILVALNNQDEVEYEIVSVERRTSTEADFLADRKLSLVVLFYDEESEDRWVITGER